MFDIISVGDTTLDVFIELDEAQVLCDIDKDACKICFNYADKIPVNKLTKVYAVGNAANVAVGASRLGMTSAIYTIVGEDETGDMTRKTFENENVALDFLTVDKGTESNYSTVVNYKGERTIFVYHINRDYQLPDLNGVKWIYYTSVAEGHENLNRDIVQQVKEHGAKLAFNPGTYQLRSGAGTLAEVLHVTEVLFVNVEEARHIVGQVKEVKELAEQLHEMGPKIVVITDGSEGAYAYDGSQMLHLPIIPAPVIEKTGAGDSFATGFVGALHNGKRLEEAMKWGSANSASVIQCIGAQEGLLTIEKIDEQLSQHQNYSSTSIT